MDIDWILQDEVSLAHASRLRLGGKSASAPLKAEVLSPSHATTRGERELVRRKVGNAPTRPTLVIAGEPLHHPTFQGVGYSKETTDALIWRMKTRVLPDQINLIYTRIPAQYATKEGKPIPMPPLDDLRASALVDVQLEAGASAVIPPLPSGLANRNIFKRSLERTLVAIQTSSGTEELVGYIPTTNDLELVRDMVGIYVRAGVRFFAVDFSGASNQPSLMRTVVRTIREKLGLKRRSRSRDETYYLHVFNAATSRKSSQDITPLSDIITHLYGVDSTSSQMWGAGLPDPEKLRYYRVSDYGAYRRKALKGESLACQCSVCRGTTPSEVYAGAPDNVQERLRLHRVEAYVEECGRITERMAISSPNEGYVPYLSNKKVAANDIDRILADVKEIQAAL
ncbi:MAG TPA: hypothetical protein VEH28_00410 [Thermoplasmata archaeon]|nr:hypothetical protein [Thermoplasmata archaeon]